AEKQYKAMEIAIIGSGNVATHLAMFFHRHGHIIKQVYSRSTGHALALADRVAAQPVINLQDLGVDVGLILIAVNDDAIAEIAGQISQQTKAIVVHSSGASPLDILSAFENHGVIWPPQSLNKEVETDLTQAPFAVEGSSQR